MHSLPLKIAAIAWWLFGLPLMLAPNWLMAIYRAPRLEGPGEYNSMLFGSSLIALGVMAWLASNAPASQARIVVWGGLVANALGFCVALQRQLFSSTAIPAGWVNVAIYLGFTAMLVWLLAAVRTKD